MRLRTWFVAAVAILATVLLAGRALTALVVEHAWYDAMGASRVFWEQVIDTTLLQGGAWLAGSLFAFANLHAVRRTIAAVAVPSRVANLEFAAMIPQRRLLSITIVLAILIGFALAVPLTDWTSVAMARHGTPFVEREGILDLDLGFYVYQLPLEETLYVWALAGIVVVTTVTLLLYAITRSLRMDGRRIVASTHVRRHLSVLGAIVLLLLAWSYRLDTFDLLQQGTGPDGLFLRIDHIVTLQIDRALIIMCVIAAPILLRAGWMGQVRAAFVTLSIVLVAALGGRQVVPVLFARGTAIGDPARRDQPYVATRTLFSRRAYDVDAMRSGGSDSANANAVSATGVSGTNAGVHTRLSLAELAAHVSIWDAEAARGRATDGRSTTLDAGAPGWLRATDGHLSSIVVRRPVAGTDRWSIALTDVTMPILRDSVPDVVVGARGDDDSADEPIAAPGLRGHQLISDPAGVMGPPMRGLGMRIAQAWATQDPSLLSADTVSGPSPRLVSHRDIKERVARLAPVFTQGDDVQPILFDGGIVWAVNLYSASDHFPLSQRWIIAGDARSYFRFAATALVDASTGRVRFVPADKLDPVAHTWFDRLPNLVANARDLPAALVDALPPPTEAAIAQARTFARYGSRQDGNVVRHLPDSALAAGGPPPHLVSVHVNSRVSTLPAWSVALLDGNDQIDGVLTAIGGRTRAVFWDSTSVPRVRWSIAVDRLRAAIDSARLSVPDGTRREPRTRMGRVHVVPTDEGPALVQSLVWNRPDGAPVITKVGVMQAGRIALGFNVGDAVAGWRGVPVAPHAASEWPLLGGANRDQRISHLYETMRDAMRHGEWTRFGAAFDSLGQIVGKPPR